MFGGLLGTVQAQSTRPLSVWVGQRDVTALIISDTLEWEDAGLAQGELVATLNTTLAALPEVGDRSFVRVFDEVRATEAYRGFVTSRVPRLEPSLAQVRVRADDHGSLLDRYIPGPEVRPVESDAARIGYFWGIYASPMLSPDLTDVDVVTANLVAQDYAGMTLRRVIDSIASAATPGADWYVGQDGRLHYFASETRAAPKNVTSDTPGGGEVAASALAVDFGDSSYANAVYVAGANVTGSGWVYDHDEIARVGAQITATLQASECETAAMRNALGNMYLGRVSASAIRGSFTVYSHDADGWRAGQTLTVRSASVGINATYRIARVRTRVLASASYQYDVEFGNTRRGSTDPDDIGIGVGNLIYGELGGQSNTYVTADGVSVTDGTNIRAQLGKISATDYGLRVVGSDGTTVIIDGTSDMFKIMATGTGTFPSLGAGPNSGSNTYSVPTTLAYCPANMGFLETAAGQGYALPYFNITSVATPMVNWTLYSMVAKLNTTPTPDVIDVTFQVQNGNTDPAGGFTGRYYLMTQTAI